MHGSKISSTFAAELKTKVMRADLAGFIWNYYTYNVIDLDTGNILYETDTYDQQLINTLNDERARGGNVIIQQIHSVARRIA